jgi:hypothetical protein
MDPPMEFVPAENWYCKFCIAKNDNLENNTMENSTPVIFPQDFREVYRSPPRRRNNSRVRRRRATREARVPYNPLDGLFERMAEYRQLNNRSRSDRLNARRNRIQEEISENEDGSWRRNGRKRIKYKTKENDRYELQERRLIEEQEVLIREHLMNGNPAEGNGEGELPYRTERSRSQDRRDGGDNV